MRILKYLSLTLLCSHSIGISHAVEPSEKVPKSIDEITLLGMTLPDNNLNIVRKHLWKIGGFLQAQSTIKQRSVDRFFTWTRIRDSYYVTFRYDSEGNVTSAYRLFRPYSTEFNNQHTAIQTRDVALKIIEQIGKPTLIKRKSWAGSPDYSAYVWQGKQLTVVVDRVGSELYGNVFIEYTVNRDPFLVAEGKTSP